MPRKDEWADVGRHGAPLDADAQVISRRGLLGVSAVLGASLAPPFVSDVQAAESAADADEPLTQGVAAATYVSAVVIAGADIDPTGVNDSTTAIQAKITDARARGARVFWPEGTYRTTASLEHLHTVRHGGPGAITRGTSRFRPEPMPAHTNTLHVAVTGSDSNDGLAPSTPKQTFRSAFDALVVYGPVLSGSWQVVAAAGTYPASSGQQALVTRSVNRVLVRGPAAGHPNVPSAILDGGGGAAYKHGLAASGNGVRVEFRDLKFVNFSAGAGDTTRVGCLADNESDAYFVNVHATGCSWTGIYAAGAVHARVLGGVLTGNRSGFVSNATPTTVTNTIIRTSYESGIYWSRGSQGHVDYCVFEENAIGLVVAENSRVDTVADDFRRNTRAIRTRTGGYFGEGGAKNIYNAGTANANRMADVEAYAGSGDSTELGRAQQYVRVAYDRTARTLTGTTARTTLCTPYTIPARRLFGVGKQLRVHVLGVFTATTAGSVLTVSFGGMDVNFTVPAAERDAPFEIDVSLLEVSGGYRAIGRLGQGAAGTRHATASRGFSVNEAQGITVKAKPAASRDALALYRTDIYVMG